MTQIYSEYALNNSNSSSQRGKQGAFVESTFMSVSDSAIEKARDELNQKAFDSAKTRAEAMANIAGLKVTK